MEKLIKSLEKLISHRFTYYHHEGEAIYIATFRTNLKGYRLGSTIRLESKDELSWNVVERKINGFDHKEDVLLRSSNLDKIYKVIKQLLTNNIK